MSELTAGAVAIPELVVDDQDENAKKHARSASVEVDDDSVARLVKRSKRTRSEELLDSGRVSPLKRGKTGLAETAETKSISCSVESTGGDGCSVAVAVGAVGLNGYSALTEGLASPRKRMAPFHFCMVCGKDVGLTSVEKRLQHVRRCIQARDETTAAHKLPPSTSDEHKYLESVLAPLRFCPFCKSDVRETRSVVAADTEAHLLACPGSVGQTLDHLAEFIGGLFENDNPPLPEATLPDQFPPTTAPAEVPDPPAVAENRYRMEQVCIAVDTDTEERWEPRIHRVPVKPAVSKSKTTKIKVTRQSKLVAIGGSLAASPKSGIKTPYRRSNAALESDSKITTRRSKKQKTVPVEYDLRYSKLEGRRRRKEEPMQTVREVSCARALVEGKIRVVLSLQPSHIENYMRSTKRLQPLPDKVDGEGQRSSCDTDSEASLWAIAALNNNHHSTRHTDLLDRCEFGIKPSRHPDEPNITPMQFTQEESKVARETEGRILTVMAVYDSEARDREHALEQEIAKLRKQHSKWLSAHTVRRNQEIEEIKLKSQARAVGIQQTRNLFARSAASSRHSAAADTQIGDIVEQTYKPSFKDEATDPPRSPSPLTIKSPLETTACNLVGEDEHKHPDTVPIHQPWDPHITNDPPPQLASVSPIPAAIRASVPVTVSALLVPELEDDASCPSSPDLLDSHASLRSSYTSSPALLQLSNSGNHPGSHARRRAAPSVSGTSSPGPTATSHCSVPEPAYVSNLPEPENQAEHGVTSPPLCPAHEHSPIFEPRSPICEFNLENDNYFGIDDHGYIEDDGVDYWPGDGEINVPGPLSPLCRGSAESPPQYAGTYQTSMGAYSEVGHDGMGTPPPLPRPTVNEGLQETDASALQAVAQPDLLIVDDVHNHETRWTQDSTPSYGILQYGDENSPPDADSRPADSAPSAVDLDSGGHDDDNDSDSDSTSPSSDVDDSVPIDDRLFAYIRAQTALYSRILVYEALDMEALHAQVVSAKGLERCSRKALGRFLDSKGINYVLPMNGKKNGGRRRWK
ncbi:hypothetical protein HDU86_007282 [Geranomyces michiganensis]|nr:hypothetical protein HDU86_007282 [Geranomyces michiganensis]